MDAGAAAASLASAMPSASGGNVAPPPIEAFTETRLAKAKLRVRLPPGATVPTDQAGIDEGFAGRHFRVIFASGYDVYFAERHGSGADDIAAERHAYRTKARANARFLYEAADAVVVRREDPPPLGAYCEVTACHQVGGRPFCASFEGARVDGTHVAKLTDDECLAVVTIARSIDAE